MRTRPEIRTCHTDKCARKGSAQYPYPVAAAAGLAGGEVPQPTAGTDGGGQKRARCKWWGELTLTYRARGGGGGGSIVRCGGRSLRAKTLNENPSLIRVNFPRARSLRRCLLKREAGGPGRPRYTFGGPGHSYPDGSHPRDPVLFRLGRWLPSVTIAKRVIHTPPSLLSAVQASLLLYVDAAVAAGVVSVRIGSPYVVYIRVAFGASAGPARPPMVLVGVRADMGLATLPAGAVQGT
jgi:hypothetical protein